MNSQSLKNIKICNKLIYDVQGRTKTFFGMSPFRFENKRGIDGYQMGLYCAPFGEVYGNFVDLGLMVTGRGTGKSRIMQQLCGADLACFLPYFLQALYHEPKPVPIDIVCVANVKKNAFKIVDGIKGLIRQNPSLEKELVDYNAWKKEGVMLKNGCGVYAEGSSDRTRGYHKRHKYGKVIYFLEEAAFWGGSACMDLGEFVDNIASQSIGASIWVYTTPYGKRGGVWRYWNDPSWLKVHVPSWANPYQDINKLCRKKLRLEKSGRKLVIEQEMKGQFVDDAGLFFSNEIWLKATNPSLEWMYDGTLEQVMGQVERAKERPGEFILSIDPNKGVMVKGGDPIGINLTEKISSRKYINRFTAAYHGKTEAEMLYLFKMLFKYLNIVKVNFDSGGGYWKGFWTMFKNMNVRNMFLVNPQGAGVVEYMMNLRTAMSLGFWEMPESEDLKESQQTMKGFGDVDEGESEVLGKNKFQTDGKKSGIPCDLCAMGLSMAREKFPFGSTIGHMTTKTTDILTPSLKVLETVGIFDKTMGGLGNRDSLDVIEDLKLTSVGIN
jgi:hypothetical protein